MSSENRQPPAPFLPYPDHPSTTPPTTQNQPPANFTPSYPEHDLPENSTNRKNISSSPTAPSSAGSDVPPALRLRDRRDPRLGQSSIAERRGKDPKQLPESPIPESPETEGLFQRIPQRENPQQAGPPRQNSLGQNPYPDFHQQYFPPPKPAPPSSSSSLQPPSNAISRISSTASTSTTKAQRGSPPPPETPVVGPGQQPGSDIEARYAASGIASTSTLNNLHPHNSAAQQRAQQYVGHQPRNNRTATPQQNAPVRPWTPTELPGTQPHGPPTIYQGATEVTPTPVSQPASTVGFQPMTPATTPMTAPATAPTTAPVTAPVTAPMTAPVQAPNQVPTPQDPARNGIENEFQRMNLTASPPPAYSSLAAAVPQNYPPDKHGANVSQQTLVAAPGSVAGPATPSVVSSHSSMQGHPAFANDFRQQQTGSPSQNSVQSGHFRSASTVTGSSTPAPGPGPASPPPLPEGWIAHLDPNSGQYYYIHLATQSTQWEFPKGPTPLNLNETPLSPAHSTFKPHGGLSSPGLSAFGKPLASPAMSVFGQPQPSPGLPMSPGYEGSVMSMNGAFTGPPPSSGIELYKVAPTNGVYFGPYLRYTNMDIERGLWHGSILLVTDAPQPPTIHIHKSADLSPNPRQLNAVRIAAHQRWTFYKYSISLQMEDSAPAKWTYAMTSHLGCTRYEFLVAGRHETNWRFISISGNDFSLNVNANERSRVGGVGYMWKDIMQKHVECGGFHAQLCLGGQINADRLWKELPSLKQWLAISGKEARKNAAWTATLEEDTTHAYFHYYTSHFDQPHLREAFAQIPYVSQVDDHDMYVDLYHPPYLPT